MYPDWGGVYPQSKEDTWNWSSVDQIPDLHYNVTIMYKPC